MKRILVTLPVTEEQKKAYAETAPEAEFIYRKRSALTAGDVKNVTAVIGNVLPEWLAENPDIEWVQLNTAGTDGYLTGGVLPETAVLTNATGAYGVAIAEHMAGALLLLLKKFPAYLDNQRAHLWKDEGMVRSIYGMTILIVGMGDIGTEFAVRMKAFGSHIIGVRRTVSGKPDCVDEIYTADCLPELVKRADVTAICLPGTKETYHLFDEKMLSAMKPGSILLNVGRGSIVDTEALTAALKSGHLGGASVDVCEEEPLPEASGLWDCGNCFITPHVSGGFHMAHTLERIVEISRENLDAYINGGAYVSPVDKNTGYKKSGV